MEDPARILRREVEVFVLVGIRLYREGIADAFAQDQRFRLVGRAGSVDGALARLDALARPPEVTLVDVGLPEGPGAAHALRAACPALVALHVGDAESEILSWAEAGVAGIVSRDATLGELLDAVEAAARDEALTSPAVTSALLRRVAAVAGIQRGAHGAGLTRREREILALISRGLSNKEIAQALRIELPTVKNHVHNLLEKLQVGSRGDAVRVARSRGELDPI